MTKKIKPQFLLLPVLFPILHIAYGVGTFVGLIKMPFWKHKLGKAPYERIEEVRQTMINNRREPDKAEDAIG